MHRYIPISIPDDFYVGGRESVYATIDSDLIDSTLTNFPVGIELGDITFMADRSATDWQNLHCTVGGTECYVEVDVWDVTTPQAILHVKVASVSSSADTVIDIRFGADNTTTYVGQTGDAAAQNVWDSNFVAVYHMSQDPSGGSGAILDSTSNANNGTSAGTMTSGDLVDGDFGKALDFDGTNDYINTGSSFQTTFRDSHTIELFVKPNDGQPGSVQIPIGTWNAFGQDMSYIAINGDGTSGGVYGVSSTIASGSDSALTDGAQSQSTYYSSTANDADDTLKLYINGAVQTTVGDLSGITMSGWTNTNNVFIAANNNNGTYSSNMGGQISEVRISNTARSAAWIKATNAVLAKTLVTLS